MVVLLFTALSPLWDHRSLACRRKLVHYCTLRDMMGTSSAHKCQPPLGPVKQFQEEVACCVLWGFHRPSCYRTGFIHGSTSNIYTSLRSAAQDLWERMGCKEVERIARNWCRLMHTELLICYHVRHEHLLPNHRIFGQSFSPHDSYHRLGLTYQSLSFTIATDHSAWTSISLPLMAVYVSAEAIRLLHTQPFWWFFHDDATHVSHRRSFLTFAGRVISHARACNQLAEETNLPAGTVPGNNMTGVLRQICDIVLVYPGHLQLWHTSLVASLLIFVRAMEVTLPCELNGLLYISSHDLHIKWVSEYVIIGQTFIYRCWMLVYRTPDNLPYNDKHNSEQSGSFRFLVDAVAAPTSRSQQWSLPSTVAYAAQTRIFLCYRIVLFIRPKQELFRLT
jgi:hypothetical protein